MPEPAAVAAPAAPASAEPAAPAAPAAEPKTIASVGDSAFARLGAEPKAPEVSEKEDKPPLNPDDETANDKPAVEPELSPEVKKLLNDAIAKGKYIPKERMDEVLKEMKAFKDFGTLDDLKQMRQTLYDLMAKAGDKRDGADPEPSKTVELTEEEKGAREFFLKAFPEFKDLMALKDEFPKLKKDYEERVNAVTEASKTERTNLVKTGCDNIKSWAEKAGIDVSDGPSYGAILDGVNAFLESDEALAKGFYQDRNMDSLKTAFDRYYEKVFSKFQRSAKADLLKDKTLKEGIPKAPARGGGPVPVPEQKVKSIKDAGDRAWSRLNS